MVSGFQEKITVTPPNGCAREISAIVEREDPNPQMMGGGFTDTTDGIRPFPANGVRFHISNDHEKGLTTVKEGYLKVSLPIRVGESPSELTVTQILSQDCGMFFLEAVK